MEEIEVMKNAAMYMRGKLDGIQGALEILEIMEARGNTDKQIKDYILMTLVKNEADVNIQLTQLEELIKNFKD